MCCVKKMRVVAFFIYLFHWLNSRSPLSIIISNARHDKYCD